MSAADIFKDYLPPEEFMPSLCRLLPELDYPDRVNLAEELLDRSVTEHADKIAIYYEALRITYRELQIQSNQFANALRDLGVSSGDRVALCSHNIPQYFVWNFACWRIGAIPVLVSHLDRVGDLAFKVNDSDAVAICIDAENSADVLKARSECPGLRHVIVHGDRIPGTLSFGDLLFGQPEQAVSEDTSREDFARIIYSSGTTGRPKAILTTIEGILAVCDTQGRHILKVRSNDILGGHPYYSFAFGAANFLYIPWRFGASVSVISRFSPERMFELVDQHGITLLFCVPTAFRMMLGIDDAEKRYDLSTLRLGQSAGEPLPEATIREWRQRFGQTIINSLGSGELSYWLSASEETPDDKLGSCGLSMPGYENLVVDENLDPVPPGTPGELIVRGPVGQLYWRRPDAQQKGICPPQSNYAGWSRPGIYAVQDSDGYFWHQSRIDDMIVTAGYKIPGGEVEAALNDHPAVLESAVVGVPDDERGNTIKAFVVLMDGVVPSQQLVGDLQDFVKQEIEPYKYPRLIEFSAADALPRTSTDKIQRNVLRDREIARLTQERPAADPQVASEVAQSAEKTLTSRADCDGAESVLLALAELQGIESGVIPRIATAFGSGMAETHGTCGALTGGIMGLSLALGRNDLGESVDTCHAATRKLIGEFEKEFGARNCDALLGCDIGTQEGRAKFQEDHLRERCAEFSSWVTEAATMLISDAKAG